METASFVAIYRVDFVPPASPTQLTLRGFEDALDALLNAAAIGRRHDGVSDDGVGIARTEGLDVAVVDRRVRDFTVRHTVRFDDRASGMTPPSPAERLRLRLVDDLDLHPRQVEGPFNIVGLDVRPL